MFEKFFCYLKLSRPVWSYLYLHVSPGCNKQLNLGKHVQWNFAVIRLFLPCVQTPPLGGSFYSSSLDISAQMLWIWLRTRISCIFNYSKRRWPLCFDRESVFRTEDLKTGQLLPTGRYRVEPEPTRWCYKRCCQVDWYLVHVRNIMQKGRKDDLPRCRYNKWSIGISNAMSQKKHVLGKKKHVLHRFEG